LGGYRTPGGLGERDEGEGTVGRGQRERGLNLYLKF